MGNSNQNPFSLASKTVLITGAGGGIGSETARVCAALGANLILADLQEPMALANELRALDCEVKTICFDVRDREKTQEQVNALGALDGVVVNAGFCPWDDWNDAGWDDVFDTVIDINVKSVVHLARTVLPGMMANGSGKIVVISSLAARSGGLRASPHYIAAKGGVSAMVKWLARKAASANVCVNAVCPGATQTAMTDGQPFDVQAIPMQRMARAREIALPVAFLLSDGANYMTGATLDVNGGVYMN
jgi:NAD(P)-dependent dehydrogenase (short-subunit alcohol dehydrogenase family)